MNYEMLRNIYAARRKWFLFLGFLLLLNIALWLYLSSWQRPALATAQSDWMAKREALKSGQSLGAATIYQNGVRDLALFDKRFIPKREFTRFINQLYESAQSNSLEMKGITYKPGAVKEARGLLSYAVTFTVSGKYASVKSFLADFSRYKEIVTLDSIALSNPSRTEESVSLRIQMTAYLKTEGA